MNDTCSNLMENETNCFDCMACEVEECVGNITNCDEYLATVYKECCVENCDAIAVGAGQKCAFSLWTLLGLLR